MKTNKIITDLTGYKKRLPKKYRLLTVVDRWKEIDLIVENVFKNPRTSLSKEMCRYIPISMVSVLQGYFRMLIRDIVNDNQSNIYTDKLIEKKFNISELIEFKESKIKTGEFIAHFADLNSIDQINRYMSNLTGCDFIELIKQWDMKSSEYNKEYFPNLLENMNKMFEIRNIFVHEISKNREYNKNEITDFVLGTINFIFITDLAIDNKYKKNK